MNPKEPKRWKPGDKCPLCKKGRLEINFTENNPLYDVFACNVCQGIKLNEKSNPKTEEI